MLHVFFRKRIKLENLTFEKKSSHQSIHFIWGGWLKLKSLDARAKATIYLVLLINFLFIKTPYKKHKNMTQISYRGTGNAWMLYTFYIVLLHKILCRHYKIWKLNFWMSSWVLRKHMYIVQLHTIYNDNILKQNQVLHIKICLFSIWFTITHHVLKTFYKIIL